MRPLARQVALLVPLLLVPAAGADLVTIPFAGPITLVSSDAGPLPGFTPGALVSGQLAYDPASAVPTRQDPGEESYRLTVDLRVVLSGSVLFEGPAAAVAEVRDLPPGAGDFLVIQDLAGLAGPNFLLTLADPSGAALGSTALPTALDLSAFPVQAFGFAERIAGQGRSFHIGTDSRLAAVPEPATLGPALAGLGLLTGGGLAARRRAARAARAAGLSPRA